MVNDGLGTLLVSLELGAAWVSQALSPASRLLVHTQACVALSTDLLIFHLWCVMFFLANALWEHLLCHGYSARDFFFFNLGMQINGMGKKNEQVPCRSQGSALNTCGCFTDRWEVWMRKVSKTTGLQVCAFF